jgi:malonyl-CoA/methylmalonyl-CoA synthetase
MPPWDAHLPNPAHRWLPADVATAALTSAWARHWTLEPDVPVLHDASGWLSRGGLEDATRLAAGRLHGAGLVAGDRILLSAPASIHLVVAHVAALRLGLVVVPTHTAYTAHELGHVIEAASPALAVVDRTERISEAGGSVPTVTPELEMPDCDSPPLDTASPGDVALLPFTSGTTGRPKGVPLTHANLTAGAAAVAAAWRWTANDRLVLCLPLFHMHGLGVGLHGTLLVGGSAVLQPAFDVDTVLDAVADHEATLFFGVPTMYQRLAQSPRAAELAALRLCVSGSAPLPAELHERLCQVSGQRVLERYGMTETVMNISNPYDGERRPGSVGLPLPGVEVRLAGDAGHRGASDMGNGDTGTGDAAAAGEIELRGPNVFRGYWNDPDATASAFTPDGWFRTGDVAERDPDGYYRIVGRARELIISGGYNVFPREVEDVLAEHPSVSECAVVGTPDAEWGEIVTAFVVAARGGCRPEELRAFCASRLTGYKQPRLVHLVTDLPRNALGKVLRPQLEEWARAQRDGGETTSGRP